MGKATSKGRARERAGDRGSLSGQLREILASRGDSVFSLEQHAGIPRGALARFMGGSGLTTQTLDKLAKSLGLRLVEVEKRKGNRRPRAGASVPS